MIPKKIHYCWFGRGEKNEKAKKCIASWHRFCPDYEIIEWNEDNFDVNMNGYTEMCIREKKYAFLSDYARLLILEREGGLYFDAEAGNPAVRAMLAEYDELLDGKHGTVGCPVLNTRALERCGLVKNGTLQDLGGAVIYPADYFNPYDDALGKLRRTKNTYSIHWYAKSWMSRRAILRSRLSKPWHRLQHLIGKR